MASTGESLRRAWRWVAIAAALATMLAALLGLRGELASARQGADDGRAKVEIDNFAYHPKTLRVRRGTRVVFANRDAVAHTVTRTGGGFDSGKIAPGRTFAVRFKRKGTYRFHCSIHPFMRGKVVVR